MGLLPFAMCTPQQRARNDDRSLPSSRNPVEGGGGSDGAADGAAAGWGTITAGRYAVHGGWVKDVPPVRAWFNERLRTKLFPALAKLYPAIAGDTSQLRVQARAARPRPARLLVLRAGISTRCGERCDGDVRDDRSRAGGALSSSVARRRPRLRP